MSLTSTEVQKAINAYSQWLERCVRACHEDKPNDYSVLNYPPGLIFTIRRDLIELRLMLREADNREWAEKQKDELENR